MSDKVILMVFDEKHNSRYFLANTREQIHRACRAILAERIQNKWYAGQESQYPAQAVLDSENPNSIIDFILERSREGFNYESVHFVETE